MTEPTDPRHPADGYGPPPVPRSPAGQPLAGFGPRLGAFLIDILVLGAVTMAAFLPVLLAAVLLGLALSPAEVDDERGTALLVVGTVLMYGVLFALSGGLSWVYYVEMCRRTGQTPGRRALGIRVVPLAPGAALTRGMLGRRWLLASLATGFVPGLLLLDGLWQLWDKPYRQCLHDKLADTVVVEDPR
ncbi:RDD family protein [Pilimelia terevasa]|uniref:RDD family protein n=1 Tax=Pilimelia terevasa TaxID=53372 RepID=A0A8J3FDF2_9ACTN|nr:RDD family protein [Pilimelia terevasa]GGK12645.1 RDD family protein [Pilimelia terevasa]